MKRHRNVKIVATLGPASSTYEVIRALVEAGADVFRLNMSHGAHDEIRARHAIIRQVEEDLDTPIGILADLQGPKLRVGAFANGEEELVPGADFRLDLDEAEGDVTRVRLPHKEIFDALEPGASLLVNDGKIRLRVKDCGADFANCEVVVGGTISNRKGVNVPDVVLPLAALSEKDRKDLEFVCDLGVDWLALSFVQRAADVEEARELCRGRAAILSKIEKPAAVKAFNEILSVSDGIMVARGDLGVELPVQNVPPIQKRLVRRCRAAAKPVIVATQMLESMIESPMRPAPRSRTSPPRSTRAPTRSCSRPNQPPGSIRSRRSRRWTTSPTRSRPTAPTARSSKARARSRTTRSPTASSPPRARSPRPPTSRRSAASRNRAPRRRWWRASVRACRSSR
ncbi:pyruvate kinase [Limimaricola cinnabarinus LL-001]|uniref:Pyruvate kinase n=1 Tax=Limimaricola cinnabarinus LL-001 TaxID=1337093 RepID=U3AL95_9RHOB|nr:pyruvate kinase [Limimaricola cinnabarinus LL-001]